MIRQVGVLLALVLAVLAVANGASAQRNPLIRQGQEQYDDLRYEEALQTLSAGLVRSGNTVADRVTLYRLLAFTYLALGREEEAEGAYRSLLALEPEFQPGSEVAPRIRDFFSGVRTRWEGEGRPGTAQPAALTIRHRSPPQGERNRAVTLEAQVEDPDGRMAGLVLAYRQGTSAVFTRIETQVRGANYVAQIPAEAVRPPLVEYYFEAVDSTGLPIAQRGDVAAPLRIAVPAPGEGGGVLSQWWFWTVVGVVVVGGIVGAVLIFGGDDGGQAPGNFVITVR